METRSIKKCLSLLLLFAFLHAYGQHERLSIKEMKADIRFLKSALEESHPNLYYYSPKSAINACFDSLNSQLDTSMSDLEFYRYITPLCSYIKDGHTIFLPGARTTDYYNENAPFFPFKIYWTGEKMYVELNYTTRDEIENGAEILSINRVPAGEIMQTCLSRMMRDGENQTYPIWVLNNWFNEYYSYFYGHPASFFIEYRRDDGSIQTKTVKGISKQEIFDNRAKRYPDRTFSRTYHQKEGSGILLEIDKEKNFALLTIKDFENEILNKTYHQHFFKTIKHYFDRIQESGVGNLILDIRNNQGGDIENGQYLLSYLMSKPFRLVDSYSRVVHSAEELETNRNKPSRGPSQGVFKPKSDAFKGNLYLLVNGGSFSNSGIVTSAIRAEKRGTIIGEETGGNERLINGDAKGIILPNSKITVDIPTLEFQIREKSKNTGHGIVPDVLIKPTIHEMMKGRDEILEYAIGLIKKR